ncbi:hypothetical protein EV426DRAFT_580238 [Tirmania nivea]|nr:hypothetical protein EV426DRAFT_580238 [Tirmania nivea]
MPSDEYTNTPTANITEVEASSPLSQSQQSSFYSIDGIDSPRIPETPIDSDSTLTIPSFELGSSLPADSIWSLRTSSQRSWIWRHGDAVMENGCKYWKCNICRRHPKRYADGSTKHPIEHLKTHRMTEHGLMPVVDLSTSAIHQAFGVTIPRIQFNLPVFQQLLVQWIASDKSKSHLFAYLTAVSPAYTAILQALLKSGNTVRAWLSAQYMEQKNILISSFRTIHFILRLIYGHLLII